MDFSGFGTFLAMAGLGIAVLTAGIGGVIGYGIAHAKAPERVSAPRVHTDTTHIGNGRCYVYKIATRADSSWYEVGCRGARLEVTLKEKP